MKKLKEFLKQEVGNQISGVMPMWFLPAGYYLCNNTVYIKVN